jgi:hypothetical protein
MQVNYQMLELNILVVTFWVMTPYCGRVQMFLRSLQPPSSSEILVIYPISTRCLNPEDNNLNLHRYEIFKSGI